MNNPLLLKAKFEAGIPLKQIITENNHDEVVDLITNERYERYYRVKEYFKEIVPKAYRNELPKLKFIEKFGKEIETLEALVTADNNNEIIIVRPNIVRNVVSELLRFDGFKDTYNMLLKMFQTSPQYAHVKAEELAGKFLNETVPDELAKVMESTKSVKFLSHSAYMALHKLVFPDDPN